VNIAVIKGRALRSSRELVTVGVLNSSPSWEPREDQCNKFVYCRRSSKISFLRWDWIRFSDLILRRWKLYIGTSNNVPSSEAVDIEGESLAARSVVDHCIDFSILTRSIISENISRKIFCQPDLREFTSSVQSLK
jgi:hypothetical protein